MAEYEKNVPLPVKQEAPFERKARRALKSKQKAEVRLKVQTKKWDPQNNTKPHVTSNAYTSLFVGRLSFDLTEEDLKHEFEFYGPVVKVHLARDNTGKSRGYGFVEFSSSKDMEEAYHDADGRKINGRRIVVDVERGRTVPDWKPRRLGGGMGLTRVGGKDQNVRLSGRAQARRPRDARDERSRDRGRPRGRERESRGRDRRSDREWRDRQYPRARERSRDTRHERRHSSRSRRRSRERSLSPRRRR